MTGNIIMSGPMVRALLEGRKTQTRRLAWKREPDSGSPSPSGKVLYSPGKETPWLKIHRRFKADLLDSSTPLPYREWLYVRETWVHGLKELGQKPVYYRATEDDPNTHWRPSIHMPRADSRLTLEVTATKPERLQDISEKDALAEGMESPILPHWPDKPFVSSFRGLWNSLHKDHPWDSNPEVVVLTFKVHQCNIDQMEGAA